MVDVKLQGNNTVILNSTDQTNFLSLGMEIAVTLFPAITIVVNLPGIAMVIRAMLRKDNVKNLHLFSIGITDALVGITSLLMAETFKHRETKVSLYDCASRYYMFSVAFVASLFHVLGICIQRIKIVLNFENNQPQTRRITEWIVIALSWVVSFLVHLLPLFSWVNYEEVEVCSMANIHTDVEKIELYFGTIYLIIILTVLIIMAMLFKLVYVGLRITTGDTTSPKDLRSCATIAVMAVIFVITTTPLSVALLATYESRNQRSQIIWKCVVVSLLNSVINPFVYLFGVKEHRKDLRKLLLCTQSIDVQVLQISVVPFPFP